MPSDRGIGRSIDPGLRACTVADPDHRIEEADPLDEFDPLIRGLAIEIGRDRHMVGISLEYDRGCQRVASAPPQPHGSRVTRGGGHALAQ